MNMSIIDNNALNSTNNYEIQMHPTEQFPSVRDTNVDVVDE